MTSIAKQTRILLAAAAIAAALPLASGLAEESMDARLAGAELHRNAKLTLGLREEIWRLHANHTLRGNYRLHYDVHFPSGGGQLIEGGVNGEWAWDNGRLCVRGYGIEHPGRQCYTIAPKGSASTSRREYTMTNVGTGQVWQMFLYKRGEQ